jgi:hypothetical protein
MEEEIWLVDSCTTNTIFREVNFFPNSHKKEKGKFYVHSPQILCAHHVQLGN